MSNESEYRMKADGTVVMSYNVFCAIPADRVVNLLGTTASTKRKTKAARTKLSRQDVRIDVLLGA